MLTRAFPARTLSQRTNSRSYSTANKVNVAVESFNTELATVGVFVKTGSAFENESNNGVSNLFQRLAFKGTNSKNQNIAKEIENIGGTLKSYTQRDRSVFLAKVLKQDVSTAVELLSEAVQTTKFSPDTLQKEKNSILGQIEAGEHCSKKIAFEFLHSTAFQGSSLALPVIGTKESVSKLSEQNLSEYAKEHLTAQRVAVVGVGAVGDNFTSLVESKFSTLPSAPYKAPENNYIASAVTLFDDSHHYFDAIVGFKGVSPNSEDYVPLTLIRHITGDYNVHQLAGNRGTTRLNELVATAKSAEKFNTFNLSYHNAGLFGVYYKADGHSAEDLTNVIVSEFVRLSNSASETELNHAKNQLKLSLLSFNGSTQIAEHIGDQLHQFGRRIPNDELFAKIDAVSVETIRSVAAKYFTHVEPVSVATGDIYYYPDYNQIRAWTYWNRV